jgi:hypothetical protein
MSNEDDSIYDLRVTFRVKLKKWRIDDQSILSNRKWTLMVYDEVVKEKRNTAGLDRPGEAAWIESVTEIKDP